MGLKLYAGLIEPADAFTPSLLAKLDLTAFSGRVTQQDDHPLVVARTSESRQARSLHGLTRSLLSNMIEGVETGFKKDLEIRGVGYRASTKGKTLTLNVGFSHPIEYAIPADIEITVVENTKVTVQGMNKQQVGQVAADIRAYRPPEPYKGKGIRYVDEFVLQKVGKSI